MLQDLMLLCPPQGWGTWRLRLSLTQAVSPMDWCLMAVRLLASSPHQNDVAKLHRFPFAGRRVLDFISETSATTLASCIFNRKDVFLLNLRKEKSLEDKRLLRKSPLYWFSGIISFQETGFSH